MDVRHHRHRANFYASGGLERAHREREDPDWLRRALAAPETRLVPVWRTRNLVLEGDAARAALFTVAEFRAAFAEIPLAPGAAALLGLDAEVPHFAVDVSTLTEDEIARRVAGRAKVVDLRAVGPLMPRREGALLAYARGLLHWHDRHRFCGACGAPTASENGGHARKCTNAQCGASHFPRTDPAVIMLVHDGGERVILGRQRIWPAGNHSVLAGFVEPGESLEDAVAREVFEEVGIAVTDIAYRSSQPWPFPASIMLGFTARALDGRLAVNTEELELARWFTRQELLASPENDTFRLARRDSIARRLIEDWMRGA